MTTAYQQRILDTLKQSGPMTAQQLATALNMTSMGARQLLLPLRETRLVIDFDKAEKVGRPSKYWKLTEQGHARYPDRHNELTVQIIHSVKHIFGDEGLEKLIKDRERNMLKHYQAELAKHRSLNKKLQCLAEIRTKEGYMASIEKKGKHYLLIENHCPICDAAKTCQQFCRSEQEIFQKCLGKQYKVMRIEHIINHSLRCVYQIETQI